MNVEAQKRGTSRGGGELKGGGERGSFLTITRTVASQTRTTASINLWPDSDRRLRTTRRPFLDPRRRRGFRSMSREHKGINRRSNGLVIHK